ncbi:SAM-dependent methyltransferase [Peptoniphilus sp.]|jgi:tetrapyrrole methylase family protein/MazG family protein|uniref:SAM-dependent methyltransferase n=1 Tax=Peptoniphilus sp. TaxID=1971214 RepID=UPI003D8C00C0
MINIVGLGATCARDLTLEAVRVINNGNRNFLRTDRHEAVKYFIENNIEFISFDYLYDNEDSFEKVYESIVDNLSNYAKNEDINYFVPGTPLVAEKTVNMLIDRGLDINIINGISFIEPVLASVGRDAVNGLIFLDSDASKNDFVTDKDILITQVYNERIASDLSIKLQEVYDPMDEAFVITDAGLSTEEVNKVKIFEISRLKCYNHQSCVYIPKSNVKGINNVFDKIESDIEDKNLFTDDSLYEKFRTSIINSAKNISEDSEDEIEDIFIKSLYLLKLKESEGYINFGKCIDEIYKKLDKIEVFLK